MKITVTGGDEIGKALSKLASTELRQKVTRLVTEELKSMSELAFRSARFRPTEWAEWAPATKAQRLRRKKKPGTRILVDTGTLMRSLGVESGEDDGMALGTTTTYGVYHQYGTKKMPARPFVPVTGDFGGEATPTAVAEKRMLRTLETAMKIEMEDFMR